MRLRSGKDVYDRVLESFKGQWPTRRQSRSLAIQTDDLNAFLKHCQWLIEKIVNDNRDAARLTTFAISESLFACHGLQPKVWVRSVSVVPLDVAHSSLIAGARTRCAKQASRSS